MLPSPSSQMIEGGVQHGDRRLDLDGVLVALLPVLVLVHGDLAVHEVRERFWTRVPNVHEVREHFWTRVA